MPPAIQLENVSKTFDIVHQKHTSLKSAILSLRRPKPDKVRVLDSVTLAVSPGEALSIIGRNGSGKSTLLGIIGRVYKPTSGTVNVIGRMFTMLDAGADAGFHPELTGKENVFFYGAIIGLRTQQIRASLKRILEFSELGDFADAPVKTYSAGMMMRLGFAIAVETDPDILLIDEALAVGDGAFQRKCFSRIESLKHSGRTIVFVTHDLEAARSVSTRTVWLDGGRVRADGDPGSVVSDYADYICREPSEPLKENVQ